MMLGRKQYLWWRATENLPVVLRISQEIASIPNFNPVWNSIPPLLLDLQNTGWAISLHHTATRWNRLYWQRLCYIYPCFTVHKLLYELDCFRSTDPIVLFCFPQFYKTITTPVAPKLSIILEACFALVIFQFVGALLM